MRKKRFVVISLLLLTLLTTNISYSYWRQTHVNKPNSFSSNKGSLVIGTFTHLDFGSSLLFDSKKTYEPGMIVEYDGRYFIVTERTSGKLPIPNDNKLTPFQPLYDSLGANHARTNANGYHINDGILYRYKKNANGQTTVQTANLTTVYCNQNINYLTGLNEEEVDITQAKNYISYCNGGLFITNSMYDPAIKPTPGSIGWTVLNSPYYFSKSLYKKGETNPYISVLHKNAQGIYETYQLIPSSNLVDGKLIAPGTDDSVWKRIN